MKALKDNTALGMALSVDEHLQGERDQRIRGFQAQRLPWHWCARAEKAAVQTVLCVDPGL